MSSTGFRVSIPVWFDWEIISVFISNHFLNVSIPVWFDWERGRIRRRQLYLLVSIPVWFDWECAATGSNSVPTSSFNSSMVRLGDGDQFIENEETIMFQFQYGSIGSCCNPITAFLLSMANFRFLAGLRQLFVFQYVKERWGSPEPFPHTDNGRLFPYIDNFLKEIVGFSPLFAHNLFLQPTLVAGLKDNQTVGFSIHNRISPHL